MERHRLREMWANKAADAIGVTPHSDMRVYVKAAVIWALKNHTERPAPHGDGKTHYCYLASEMVDPSKGLCEVCDLHDDNPAPQGEREDMNRLAYRRSLGLPKADEPSPAPDVLERLKRLYEATTFMDQQSQMDWMRAVEDTISLIEAQRRENESLMKRLRELERQSTDEIAKQSETIEALLAAAAQVEDDFPATVKPIILKAASLIEAQRREIKEAWSAGVQHAINIIVLTGPPGCEDFRERVIQRLQKHRDRGPSE